MAKLASQEMLNRYFIAENESTFQYDETLPPLPVPRLEQTLEKYLESIRPFVTQEEYDATFQIVRDFENGTGKILHEKLLERAKRLPNWLESWWLQMAYLTSRQPLIPMSNTSGPMPSDDPMWAPGRMDQVTRAALITHLGLHYWRLLRREKLKPDKPRGQPWSMSQWRTVYNTHRLPGEYCDSLKMEFKTASQGPPASKHCVVLHRGRIFYMDLIDVDEEPLTVPELQQQFQNIVDRCASSAWGQSVAALSCDERTRYAKNWEYLIQLHPINAKNIEIMQSTIKVVVLDENSPTNDAQIFEAGLGGEVGGNRYADTLQSIIFKNGTVAMCGDHTPADGMVGISYGNFLFLKMIQCGGQWNGTKEIRPFPEPKELIFHLDDNAKSAIQVAINSTKSLIQDLAVTRFPFRKFGKNLITAQHFNPDSFIQMALQLAYFRLHNKPAPTYETATVRTFYNGRTETVRSCTLEAITWAKAMLDSKSTQHEKLELLKTAITKHDKLMAEGKKNEGLDRHLLGLFMISYEAGMPIPEIFTDPPFVKSGGNGNFVLSTSLVGYSNMGGGVAAMTKDGYGVFYGILPNAVKISITGWKSSQETDIHRLQDSIIQTLGEMQELFTNSSL